MVQFCLETPQMSPEAISKSHLSLKYLRCFDLDFDYNSPATHP